MTWRQGEAALPTISKVDALDGDCFDIQLSNGHSIFLELGERINEPAFAKLIEQRLFDRPQTDGQRLYWVGGPSFTVAEIFSMLARGKERQETTNLKGDEMR
ncbi:MULTISPECIES: hypothetical protein [Oscillibacter]|jgi:hypothetical protein|uniref:hypothetical protein n=1 Tax=Oscillibacter TaxID=459786 RepID=UPI00289B8D5E|nr:MULTISPECIES: hypothetical protein [Oscillibacter]MEA5041087.1 hypothetical protein [Oscillibacter ruminantium]